MIPPAEGPNVGEMDVMTGGGAQVLRKMSMDELLSCVAKSDLPSPLKSPTIVYPDANGPELSSGALMNCGALNVPFGCE